jgi:hypothetical protein
MNWLDRQGPLTWGILAAAAASAVVSIAQAAVNACK